MNITGKKQFLSPSVFLFLFLSLFPPPLLTLHSIPIDIETGLEIQDINSNFSFYLMYQVERGKEKEQK